MCRSLRESIRRAQCKSRWKSADVGETRKRLQLNYFVGPVFKAEFIHKGKGFKGTPKGRKKTLKTKALAVLQTSPKKTFPSGSGGCRPFRPRHIWNFNWLEIMIRLSGDGAALPGASLSRAESQTCTRRRQPSQVHATCSQRKRATHVTNTWMKNWNEMNREPGNKGTTAKRRRSADVRYDKPECPRPLITVKRAIGWRRRPPPPHPSRAALLRPVQHFGGAF